jgi:DNA-binding IclR family transcriptional regulator
MSDEQAMRLVVKQGGLGRPGSDCGENAPRTVVELLRHLHKTRSRGFSILAEAVHIGIAAVAAPVQHIATGQVIGVLSIAGPHIRLTDKRLARLGPVLIQAAADLGAATAGSALLRGAVAASLSPKTEVLVSSARRHPAGRRLQRHKPPSIKSA